MIQQLADAMAKDARVRGSAALPLSEIKLSGTPGGPSDERKFSAVPPALEEKKMTIDLLF